MRFFNFFLIHMVQKYQNEIAPIFYYGKSPKTNEKNPKIPFLQPPDWGQPYWMTRYLHVPMLITSSMLHVSSYPGNNYKIVSSLPAPLVRCGPPRTTLHTSKSRFRSSDENLRSYVPRWEVASCTLRIICICNYLRTIFFSTLFPVDR